MSSSGTPATGPSGRRASAPFVEILSELDLGSAGALLAILHVARIATPGVADLALAPHASTWPKYRLDDTSTTLCFVLTLGLVGLGAVVWPLVRSRVGGRALDLTAVAVALALGFAASWQLGLATLVSIALVAPLLSSSAEEDAEPSPRDGPPLGAVVLLLVSDLVALGWGTWNVVRPRNGLVAAASVLVAIALGSALILRAAAGRRAMAARLAVAFSPVLLAAFLGIAREPQLLALVALVDVGIVLAIGLGPRHAVTNRAVERLAYLVAPVACVVMAVTPVAMRTLPSVNHFDHEGFHAGWIQGVLHGRFFQADVDNVYGLLREWMLTAYLFVAGMTLENLRVAGLLANLVGAALLVVAAYPWLKGRPLLTTAFVYVLVLYTPLRCLVYYKNGASFGWTDLARCALPLFGMLGSLRAMASFPAGGRLPLATLGWGCVLGASALYSQEFGVTALAATWVAYLASHALTGGSRPGLGVVLRTLAVHAAGVAAVLLATLAVYSAFGKGRLLLETSFLMLRLMGSGQIPFWAGMPVTALSFLDPVALLTRFTGDVPMLGNFDAEYLLAPAAYVLALVILGRAATNRRWTARHTAEFALTVFGIVTFRVTLSRPDMYHVLSALTPALLLGVSMADRLLRAEPRLGRVLPRAVLVFAGLLFCAATERGHGIGRHLVDLAQTGATDTAPPVILPRAGHILVEPEIVELIHYVQAHTAPTDAIFVRYPFPGNKGPDIYFLADRRLSTRFAMTQELWTDELRDQAYDDLVRDPPKLVVGDDEEMIGPRIATYLRVNYEQVWTGEAGAVFAPKGAKMASAGEGTAR